MRLAALNVATFRDQFAHLVGWDGLFALRADIKSRCRQRVVAPPHSLSRWGLPPFGNCHDSSPARSAGVPFGTVP